MKLWKVRTQAEIDDTWTVEAETEEEACAQVDEGWVFVEASSWKTTAELIEDLDEEVQGLA